MDVEDRIANLRREIAEQETLVTSLEEECRIIEDDLSDFEARYNEIVKPIITQIEAVKTALEKLRDLQLMQQMGQNLSVESLWRKRPTIEFDTPEEDDDVLPTAEKPSGSLASRIKKLYRQLARRYHPDLAASDLERERRNKIMALINTAYQEQDMDALEALNEATPRQQATIIDTEMPLAMMVLRRLQRQYEALCVRVRDLKVRRHNLRYGPLMELKIESSLARARGEDLLTELAEDMQREYWHYVSELDELRDSIS